ncbi:type II toxin-antitoxin system HicA family toxin [[Eubacterium] cellulosolvens]
MPKLPVVSGIEVVKALAKIGYDVDHQTGSHMILRQREALHIGDLQCRDTAS